MPVKSKLLYIQLLIKKSKILITSLLITSEINRRYSNCTKRKFMTKITTWSYSKILFTNQQFDWMTLK